MYQIRTDLAAEAHALWRESTEQTTDLEGVRAWDDEIEGFPAQQIEILDAAGEKALGKARGHYITLYFNGALRGEREGFSRAAQAVAAALGPLLPAERDAPVLVVGLGNRAITPDAIGPLAADAILVTRHLREQLPDQFGAFRPVSALAAGVLGATGVESGEIAKAVAGTVKPAAVIAIDALAGRSVERLCSTVQLADTGIVPGSGIGNTRAGLTLETLGVPVLAIGVPTVVEAGTLAMDLLARAGQTLPEGTLDGAGLIVAPKDVDRTVAELARVIACGINLALHPQLTLEDLNALTAGI